MFTKFKVYLCIILCMISLVSVGFSSWTIAGLEEEKISKLNDEIDNYNKEIEELIKIKLLSSKFKDVIEQENDKLKISKRKAHLQTHFSKLLST